MDKLSRVKKYWTYIASNRSGTLYTGVTSDLPQRMWKHKNRVVPGFTSKYKIDRLVYFESTHHVRAAIAREKEIKGWRREKKVRLIESVNPSWKDLSSS
jgi:putative endonuclease